MYLLWVNICVGKEVEVRLEGEFKLWERFNRVLINFMVRVFKVY